MWSRTAASSNACFCYQLGLKLDTLALENGPVSYDVLHGQTHEVVYTGDALPHQFT